MRRLLVCGVFFFVFVWPAAAMHVLDADTTPPVITVPASFTVEADNPSGKNVDFTVTAMDDVDGAVPVTCSKSSGDSFPIATTTVTCDASDTSGNSATATFDVTVADTTPPDLPQPDSVNVGLGTPVNFGPFVATDLVDGAVTAVCVPPSGSTFPVGSTTVTCTATDTHGNSTAKQFTVTVIDSTPPTFTSTPSPVTVEAAGPGGSVVTFPTPTATDDAGPPVVVCSPGSGALFPIASTTVTCTATDTSGNHAETSFAVTVQDTTPPQLSLPADITAEAASSSGKSVTYSASALDIVAGAVPVTCAPGSGSTFPIAATTVNCSANDGRGNTKTGSFTVTVRDTIGPVVTVPPAPTVEANGPTGSIVNFVASAVDAVDGAAVVRCTPGSGTTFSLGTTTVRCSANDTRGNIGRASFVVTVKDTTPPTLVVPDDRSVYATSAGGISDSDPGIVRFIAAASANDIVDLHPSITHNIPRLLPVGVKVVTFAAHDASGNSSFRNVLLTVLPVPPPGTPPLPVPPAAKAPADVRNLTATPGDGSVRLRWQAPAGVDHVVIRRSPSSGGSTEGVYTGSAATYLDRGVANGTEYRYVVTAVNAAGNASAGVAIVAVPNKNRLRSPKDGARLRKPPKLLWAPQSEADYYNAQLLRNGVKILSVWPTKPGFVLRKSWTFGGRKYSLTPGIYEWYVWPGFGARSRVDYGQLLGARSFQIVRR